LIDRHDFSYLPHQYCRVTSLRIIQFPKIWSFTFGLYLLPEKTNKKGGKGQSVRWKAWWRQGNIKCTVSEKYASCWVHQDCHIADEQKAALKKAARV